jgi:hypothetical protein
MWPKLKAVGFTTFRFERKDKDWQKNETVQVVFQPRSKNRRILGTAIIVAKDQRCTASYWIRHSRPAMPVIANVEAVLDGFKNAAGMEGWLAKTYGNRPGDEPMNKLSLIWVNREAE